MLGNITSLTGNGLKDWLIQRASALFLAVYTVWLFGWFLLHPQLEHIELQALFSCRFTQIASTLALLALSLHAWVGIWTVTTDYMKCTALRLSVQLLVALGLVSQFIWGLMIFWGQ